jgi:hypothetical protein
MLLVPRYLREAAIASSEIRYEWDDWNVEQAEEPIDDDLYARLESVTLRATVAFTIATAEWIVHRFETLSQDKLPLQYLESAWAQVVSWHYAAVTWEGYTNEKDWHGPVRGPLGVAMKRVHYAIEQAAAGEDPELRAAWISNLAEYLMVESKHFQIWRDKVLERLCSTFPRAPKDPLGDPVPREALDPEIEFRMDQIEVLINRFLRGLDPTSNPFLNSADRMREERLVGEPYLYDLTADRIRRLEE